MMVNTPQKIKNSFGSKLFSVKANEKYRLLLALRENQLVNTAFPFGDSVHITFVNGDCDPGICDYLKNRNITDIKIEETEAGIEDRFLELMNNDKNAGRGNYSNKSV
jgi:hypothetical protein